MVLTKSHNKFYIIYKRWLLNRVNARYRKCFPINKEFRQQISDAVLGEYHHVMTQMQSAAQAQKQSEPEMEAPSQAMAMGM